MLACVQGKGNFTWSRWGGWSSHLGSRVNKEAAELLPSAGLTRPPPSIHGAPASRHLCFPFSQESGGQLRGRCSTGLRPEALLSPRETQWRLLTFRHKPSLLASAWLLLAQGGWALLWGRGHRASWEGPSPLPGLDGTQPVANFRDYMKWRLRARGSINFGDLPDARLWVQPPLSFGPVHRRLCQRAGRHSGIVHVMMFVPERKGMLMVASGNMRS